MYKRTKRQLNTEMHCSLHFYNSGKEMASALNVATTLAVIRPSVEISPDHVAIMGYYYSFNISKILIG